MDEIRAGAESYVRKQLDLMQRVGFTSNPVPQEKVDGLIQEVIDATTR